MFSVVDRYSLQTLIYFIFRMVIHNCHKPGFFEDLHMCSFWGTRGNCLSERITIALSSTFIQASPSLNMNDFVRYVVINRVEFSYLEIRSLLKLVISATFELSGKKPRKFITVAQKLLNVNTGSRPRLIGQSKFPRNSNLKFCQEKIKLRSLWKAQELLQNVCTDSEAPKRDKWQRS